MQQGVSCVWEEAKVSEWKEVEEVSGLLSIFFGGGLLREPPGGGGSDGGDWRWEDLGQLQEAGVIEIAPLAYMRGRTLNKAFIILDEAQNSTIPQMKMFLTRLGFRSKMVVTGDITQVDLPSGTQSGLINAKHILKNIDGIRTINFEEKDVVRHELVKKIVHAYEHERKTSENGNSGPSSG